jgi:hypothetical protein
MVVESFPLGVNVLYRERARRGSGVYRPCLAEPVCLLEGIDRI